MQNYNNSNNADDGGGGGNNTRVKDVARFSVSPYDKTITYQRGPILASMSRLCIHLSIYIYYTFITQQYKRVRFTHRRNNVGLVIHVGEMNAAE